MTNFASRGQGIKLMFNPNKGGAHCTKMDLMGYFHGHQVTFENFDESCLKLLPDFGGFRIIFNFWFLSLKSCWKLSKHTRVFWQILYELTFYYIKCPDLLTLKSCGRLILKYSQTKPKWSIAYELELMSKGIKPILSDCWQHLLS